MDLILAEDDETEATPDDGTPVMSRDQEKRLRRAIREAQAIEATATANR